MMKLHDSNSLDRVHAVIPTSVDNTIKSCLGLRHMPNDIIVRAANGTSSVGKGDRISKLVEMPNGHQSVAHCRRKQDFGECELG